MKRNNCLSKWIKETPKKQIQKKQCILKLIILIIAFCVVVIPSIVVYFKIFNAWSIKRNIVWYSNDLFKIEPNWNDIKWTYPIWKKLSFKNKNWLIYVKIGTALLATVALALCWFFINNKVVFAWAMIAYFGIMFNCIDCCFGGKAFDYIYINKNYTWLYKTLLWPACIPLWLSGHDPFASGVINLPDVFLSIGIIGLICSIIVITVFKISEKIQRKDLKLQGIYI